MSRHSGQRGVALITAIAVVAIAVSVAAVLAFDQQLAIRNSHNLLTHAQAEEYLRAAEGLAQIALIEDASDSELDALSEFWAQPASTALSDEAEISGQLSDLQGRLNLNSLITEQGKVDGAILARLERLLRELELDPRLAAAIVDWIDPDLEPYGVGGAEDDAYTRSDPPYRAANTPMVSATELRLIAGIDAEAYAKLSPHVTALPEPTAININTATPAVLRSLGLPSATVEVVLEARDTAAFDSVGAMLSLPALQGLDIDRSGLDVRSGYFALHSQVRFASTRVAYRSLIQRNENGTLRVLRRRQELF